MFPHLRRCEWRPAALYEIKNRRFSHFAAFFLVFGCCFFAQTSTGGLAHEGSESNGFGERSIWGVRSASFSPGVQTEVSCDHISPVMSAQSAPPEALVTFAPPICSSAYALEAEPGTHSYAVQRRCLQGHRTLRLVHVREGHS